MAASPSTTKQGKKPRNAEYALVDNFKFGYRNREDVTNLPPGVLISGSQNVFTNVSERVQIRQGYALDGPTSALISPVSNSFDWTTRNNGERHLRVGGITSAANDGKLQYRYDDGAGNVTWRDLTTGLTTVAFNFDKFWDTTENLRECIYVNGTSFIFRWNGAITTLASATANTITKTGTDTWADTGFYVTANKKVIINGTEYTYTAGETTTTLTGVSPSPAAEAVGSVIHQSVVTTANSSLTGPPATFANGLMKVLNNQVFLGALNSSVLWISKVNNLLDYSNSTPRQAGEGGTLILDSNLVAFEPEENFMYVYAGQDLAYNINFEIQTSTVGVTYEQVNALLLKNGRRQAAISQAFVSHMKNDVILVTNETTIDRLGRVDPQSLATPQVVNISDPIKLDIDSYDFTNGCIFYYRFNIYVAVPQEGLVLVYNLATNSWEAPQTLPISRFYVVDGELYGHSYSTFESYKLFTGYADRVYSGFTGFPIQANWVFSYQNYGAREAFKSCTRFYVEGYINSNTTLSITLTYELDGCATTKMFTIEGSDKRVVCISPDQSSLGKVSLGKNKLGGVSNSSFQDLPPKFRAFLTFNNTDFFEMSPSFSVLGTDNRAEILSFGPAVYDSTQEPVKRTI